jgi:SAM-dependent methyltransferase
MITRETAETRPRSVVDPPSSEKPIPYAELQQRVAGDDDSVRFHKYGRQSALDFEAVLASVDRTFDSFPRILDFGCGCGRILLWLEELASRCSVYGTDIDQAAVRWASEHIPYATVSRNQPDPPLEYADAFFDLVYCHSVFTHIDENYQDRWLAELQRITKPGGLVILSVHGEYVFHQVAQDLRRLGQDPSEWQAILEEQGICFRANDAFVGGPFPDFYHSTFHTPWYVFAHWGQYFRVRSYMPRRGLDYQDYILLERMAPDAGFVPPLVPRSASVPAAPQLSATGDAMAGAGPSALVRAEALLARGVDIDAPTRYGSMGRMARRLVLRVLRHQTVFRYELDRAMLDAVRSVSNVVSEPNPMQPLTRVILTKMADRINRLEADVGARLEAQGSELRQLGQRLGQQDDQTI